MNWAAAPIYSSQTLLKHEVQRSFSVPLFTANSATLIIHQSVHDKIRTYKVTYSRHC